MLFDCWSSCLSWSTKILALWCWVDNFLNLHQLLMNLWSKVRHAHTHTQRHCSWSSKVSLVEIQPTSSSTFSAHGSSTLANRTALCVCLKVGYLQHIKTSSPKNDNLMRKMNDDNDKQRDCGIPYFQTNQSMFTGTSSTAFVWEKSLRKGLKSFWLSRLDDRRRRRHTSHINMAHQ